MSPVKFTGLMVVLPAVDDRTGAATVSATVHPFSGSLLGPQKESPNSAESGPLVTLTGAITGGAYGG